ncbi:MAG TPA: hypothetical protein VLE96_05735 [Chlamydiales bacterium]|nr:hypothetical protein [Chlamydiales bacterium]
MSNSEATGNNLGSSSTTGQNTEAYLEAQYLNNVTTEIQNIETDMTTIADETKKIEKLEEEVHNERTAMYNTEVSDYGIGVRHFSNLDTKVSCAQMRTSLIDVATHDHNIIEGYVAKIESDASTENKAASYIMSITGDQQIQQALSALNVVLGINSSSWDLSSAITFFNTQATESGKKIDLGIAVVNQIMNALKTLVSVQENSMNIKAKDKYHLASKNELEATYLENMQASLEASSTVESITSIDDATDHQLNHAILTEKKDLDVHSALYENLHALGFESSQMAKREKRLNNQQSLQAINTIGVAVSSLLASLQTDVAFAQETNLMNQLLEKMKKILNNRKMPITEKLNAVLSLMTEVLAIFNMIQQTSENQKMENEKEMAKANQTQAKNSIQNALLNEKILANAVNIEKSEHIIQSVTTWLMLAVSAVTASPAFFLFMCITAALQQSGDLDKWTKSLGDVMGAKWKADLVVASIEMGASGVFMLGEAATKAAVTALTKEALEQFTDSALDAAIDETELDTQSPCNMYEQNEDGAIDSAKYAHAQELRLEQELRTVASRAAYLAKRFVQDEYFALSPVAMAAKESAGKGLVVTTATVIKAAIKNAIEEASLLAKNNIDPSIPEIKIAVNAAAKAVSTVATTSVEEAKVMMTKNAEGFAGNVKQYMRANPIRTRMLFTYAYGLGTQNFVMDIATAEAKKNGKKLDSLQTILAGVAEAILAMIGMIGAMGSSSLETGTEMNPMLKFQKLASVALALGQLAGANSDLDVAKAIKKQAEATFNVKEEMTYQNILASVLKAMHQAQNQSARQAASKWLMETRSLNKLASHIQDADNAGIKVLMEQAV